MLKLEAVEVAYGHIQALAGVSLEVREGELVALLGRQRRGQVHDPDDHLRDRAAAQRHPAL